MAVPVPPEGFSTSTTIMISGAVAMAAVVVSLFSSWLLAERRTTDRLDRQRREFEVKYEEAEARWGKMQEILEGKVKGARDRADYLQEEMASKYITHEQCKQCKELAAGREQGIEHSIDKLFSEVKKLGNTMKEGFAKHDKILMVLVNRSPNISDTEKEDLFP